MTSARSATRRARVILVDAAPQVRRPFGAKFGKWTQEKIGKLGVEVMLGALVSDVDERGLSWSTGSDDTQGRVETVTKV